MRTKFIYALCIVLCIIAVLGCYGVSAQADNNVGLEVIFNEDIYVPGDIAEVTLNLTGLSDEVAANKLLGLFEVHIDFDPSEMIFIGTDDYEFDYQSEWLVDLSGTNDTNVFQVTDNYDDVIVLAFDKATSLNLTCDADGKLAIAKIRFMVTGCEDGKLTVGFSDEEDYPSVVAVSEVNDTPLGEYSCTNGEAAEADVKDFLVAETTAYINESGSVTADVEAGSADGGAYLIAKLYDAETGLIVAPVKMVLFEGRVNIEDEVVFENIPTDGTYNVDLYLWDSGVDGLMWYKPLAQKVTATVVAQ